MDFYTNYDENLNKIFEIRDKISGTHNINNIKANLWIESQTTELRKETARNLIENTHYFTFNQVVEYVRNLTYKIYEKIIIDYEENFDLYLFVDNKDGSTYFIGILVVYFLRLKKIYDPIIIDKWDPKILSKINGPIIFIDDMIYGGGKLSGMLQQIFHHSAREYFGEKIINIYIGVIVSNSTSMNMVNSVLDLKDNINHNIFFISELHIETMAEKIGDNKFFNIIYFFSPFDFGYPVVSCYFDHKIADASSTFLIALMYGPVLPSRLNYNDKFLITSLNTENNDGEIPIDFEYIKRLELIDIEQNTNFSELNFIPFINGCNNLPKNIIPYNWLILSYVILENIVFEYEKFRVKKFDIEKYNSRIYNESGRKITKKEKIATLEEYQNFLQIGNDLFKYYYLIEENKDPNIRCPSSWYKQNKYKLK